jgi:hypothetical protein
MRRRGAAGAKAVLPLLDASTFSAHSDCTCFAQSGRWPETGTKTSHKSQAIRASASNAQAPTARGLDVTALSGGGDGQKRRFTFFVEGRVMRRTACELPDPP